MKHKSGLEIYVVTKNDECSTEICSAYFDNDIASKEAEILQLKDDIKEKAYNDAADQDMYDEEKDPDFYDCGYHFKVEKVFVT